MNPFENPRAAGVPEGVFDMPSFCENYTFDGELGAIVNGDTVFRVWSPTATSVVLCLYDGDNCDSLEMIEGVSGVWERTVERNLHGAYYTYIVSTALGVYETPDPYARSTGVNGQRGMVLDMRLTDPEGFSNDRFFMEGRDFSPVDAIVWETHIRDFSHFLNCNNKHKFLALTETGLKNAAGFSAGVDYLKELGITHVQLMPIYDYATVDERNGNGYNWGYDPLNYNTPEGSYSTDPYNGAARVTELKRTVAALHENGLGVIMDVVYNHTYMLDSPLGRTAPFYYYRYLYDRPSDGSGCGNETASERAMMRKYIIDSVLYWQKEYHIDGFRFDLMGLIDTDTIREISAAVKAINPNAVIIGEGWCGGESVLPHDRSSTLDKLPQLENVAMFNDVCRDTLRGAGDGDRRGYVSSEGSTTGVLFTLTGGNKEYATNGWHAANPVQSVNYLSCHDNLTLWDKLKISNFHLSDNERLRRAKLAAAVLFVSQGIPFMLGGEELLRSKNGNCNSYNSGDEINAIRWDCLTDGSPEKDCFEFYKSLIAIRKSTPDFRMRDAKTVSEQTEFIETEGHFIFYTLSGGETAVIINASDTPRTVRLPDGEYDIYCEDGIACAYPMKSGWYGECTAKPFSCTILKRHRKG